MKNKIVFITGATSGIGLATAKHFAEKGNHLILTGRREERLIKIKTELEVIGAKVLILAYDILDFQFLKQNLDNIKSTFHKVDILVNNAGLAIGKENFSEGSLQEWDRMIDTNIKGIYYTTKTLLPLLKKSDQPHVVNISSIAGIQAYDGGNIYCASKAAVTSLSKTMRIDFLSEGIKVTNISPGATETEFCIVRFRGDENKAKDVYKGLDPLTGKDIADVIYYCCQLPKHVCVNDLNLTPIAQANSYYTHRH